MPGWTRQQTRAWVSQAVVLTSGALPAGTAWGPPRVGYPCPFRRALRTGPEAGAQTPREGLCFPCRSQPGGSWGHSATLCPAQPPAGLRGYRGEQGPRGCSALPPGRRWGLTLRRHGTTSLRACGAVRAWAPGLWGRDDRLTGGSLSPLPSGPKDRPAALGKTKAFSHFPEGSHPAAPA